MNEITRLDYENLVNERARLEKQKLALSEEYKVAITDGDTEYNTQLFEVMEQDSRISKQLEEIRHILDTSYIAPEENDDVIRIGKRVLVRDEESGDEDEYLISGQARVDGNMECVTSQSPMGTALLGHREGDRVEFRAPGGAIRLTVLRVCAAGQDSPLASPIDGAQA